MSYQTPPNTVIFYNYSRTTEEVVDYYLHVDLNFSIVRVAYKLYE